MMVGMLEVIRSYDVSLIHSAGERRGAVSPVAEGCTEAPDKSYGPLCWSGARARGVVHCVRESSVVSIARPPRRRSQSSTQIDARANTRIGNSSYDLSLCCPGDGCGEFADLRGCRPSGLRVGLCRCALSSRGVCTGFAAGMFMSRSPST